MAHDYLAIPATFVASECTFSAGENMITSSLVPKTIRVAQCLRSWMQRPLKEKLENL